MTHIAWTAALCAALSALGCRTRCCPPDPPAPPQLNACAAWQEEGTDLGRSLDKMLEGRTQRWHRALVGPDLAAPGAEAAMGPAHGPLAEGLRRAARREALPKILALSGGALNGAFGAGFLNGWHEAGSRPRFDVITGVSSGALQAPLVFLDDAEGRTALEHYFTNYGGSDILRERSILSLPWASSTHSPEGLERLLRRLVTADFLARVAAASTGGADGARALLAGTVELDSGTFHVWDLVKIARAGDVGRFRQVLLASASQPPLYPPVFIDGRPHVDGGVRQQVFIPCLIQALQERARSARLRLAHVLGAPGAGATTPPPGLPLVLYMVINSYVGLRPHCTQPQILDIGMRTAECLADEGLFGNIWKSWGVLQRANVTCPDEDTCFQVLTMPRALASTQSGSQALSREHVRFLYGKGREMGLAGSGWVTTPEAVLELQSGPSLR